MSFAQQLANCRVLPVIVAHDVKSTVRLAQALQNGGMRAVEITLRTPAALDSLREVKSALPGMLVAAGSVTSPEGLERALDVGVDFCVSPGTTDALLRAANEQGMPFLPGVATASEVLLGMEHGYEQFKLFPAGAVGGMQLLNSLAGPFPNARFCPTGGLSRDNFRDYLALPNVVCCGGSWMASDAMVKSGSWDEIEQLARESMDTTSG
jgi:2-dehydro-3-deoxyphosphogluconate aldolase/(4S)-4-hydroxy-2-oxoglutarate aldolase